MHSPPALHFDRQPLSAGLGGEAKLHGTLEPRVSQLELCAAA